MKKNSIILKDQIVNAINISKLIIENNRDSKLFLMNKSFMRILKKI